MNNVDPDADGCGAPSRSARTQSAANFRPLL